MLSNDTTFERVTPTLHVVNLDKLSTPQLYKLLKYFNDSAALNELKRRGVNIS